MAMTRSQAWELLTQYNKEPFHLRHAITVEHVMGWYARELRPRPGEGLLRGPGRPAGGQAAPAGHP